MAVAFRSSSNTTYASRTNTTVTAPASIADGDVLIYSLFVGASGSAPTATAPSGFSAPSGGTWPIAINDGGFFANVYVWYKIASGESGNYTATHASGSSQGVMFAASGGSSSAPTATTNNGIGATTTYTGLTTSANDALVAVIGCDWADFTNNLSPPTGTTPTFTERIDVTLTYLATGVMTTAGATGNKTMTNNCGGAGRWTGVMLDIEPSGAAATTVHRNLLLGVGI